MTQFSVLNIVDDIVSLIQSCDKIVFFLLSLDDLLPLHELPQSTTTKIYK